MIAEDSMIPSETLGKYACCFCYGEDPGIEGQIECDWCFGSGSYEWEKTVSSRHDPGEPFQRWGTAECEKCEGLGHVDCGECDGTGELPFVSCLVGIEEVPA